MVKRLLSIVVVMSSIFAGACKDECEEDPGAEGCECTHGNNYYYDNPNSDCNYGLVCTSDHECRSGFFEWSGCVDEEYFNNCDEWCEGLGMVCGSACDHTDGVNRSRMTASIGNEGDFGICGTGSVDPDLFDGGSSVSCFEGITHADVTATACCCSY